ncbi:MAG: hypothetical protein LBJ14_06380 [Desulfarculales bacterium]|nr:hypothetical protein [Desulfarculales bacterium]
MNSVSITSITQQIEQIKYIWSSLGLPQDRAGSGEGAENLAELVSIWPDSPPSPVLSAACLDEWLGRQTALCAHAEKQRQNQQTLLTSAWAEIKRLRQQAQRELTEARENCRQRTRQLAAVQSGLERLRRQGTIFRANIKTLQESPSDTHKDKLNQALLQAKALQGALVKLLVNEKKAEEEQARAEEAYSACQRKHEKIVQELQTRQASLEAVGEQLAQKQADNQAQERLLEEGLNLKPALENVLAQSRELVLAWGLDGDSRIEERMSDSLEQARYWNRRVVRLEKLLLTLGERLPRSERDLQNWQQASRDILKSSEELESQFQSLVEDLNQARQAGHPMGKFDIKLALLKARLLPLQDQAAALKEQLPLLSRALPQDLKRGKIWIEQWRASAKEERACLTQALGWQQERLAQIKESRQKIPHVRAAWQQQVKILSPLAGLWPQLAAKGRLLEGAEELLSRQEKETLSWPIPAPQVGNLVRTPLSLKFYNTFWRRWQPAALPWQNLANMEQAVAYWQNLVSDNFAKSIREPLVREKERLEREVALILEEKALRKAGRGRTAARLRRERSHRLELEAAQKRAFNSITASEEALKFSRELSLRLQTRLRQMELEDHISQTKIQALQEEKSQGQDFRVKADKLEGTLVHVSQERDHYRQNMETLLAENARLHTSQEQVRELQGALSEAGRREADSLRQLEEFIRLNEAQTREQARLEAEREREQARFKAEREREQARLEAEREQEQAINQTLHERLAESQAAYNSSQEQLADLLRAREAWRQEEERGRQAAETLRSLQQERADSQARLAELENIRQEAERLRDKLDWAGKTVKALRAKSLERHRLYRQSRQVLDELKAQQERNIALEVKQEHLAHNLAVNQEELKSLRVRYDQAAGERDQSLARLAMERSVRLALTNQALESQLLKEQLDNAREEAGRIGALAAELDRALSKLRRKDDEIRRWRAEASRQAAYAQEMHSGLKHMTALLGRPASPLEDGRRISPPDTLISSEQAQRIRGNLRQVRKLLKETGRSVLHGWAFAALLSAGLLLGNPTASGTADLRESPQMISFHPPRQEKEFIPARLSSPAASPVTARIMQPQAELLIDLTPARLKDEPLPAWIEEEAARLAGQLRLPQDTLKIQALALCRRQGQEMTPEKQSALRQMAYQALEIVNARPRIARDVSRRTADEPGDPFGSGLFYDRLYDEYRALGFSPAESLGAVAGNKSAAAQVRELWQTPQRFQGRVSPLDLVENMTLAEFVERISPYIEKRLTGYMTNRGLDYQGSGREYARHLAFDIYCAADAFAVPRTFMLAIAHQETFYANVLGDSNRSASPFQLFSPTRKLIIQSMSGHGLVPPPPGILLERHLTISAYMAAFHLKELMHRASPGGYVDTNRLMRYYNGSDGYGGWVARRQKQLAGYLADEK